MDALVNTFQQRFLCLCRDIKGKQQHKQLRNVIEEVDEEVANVCMTKEGVTILLEKEIIYVLEVQL